MKRTGSIGSRVPPAVTSTRRPSQGRSAGGQRRLDRGEQALGLGQAAHAVLAARGERALLRLDHGDAALAQRRQVRLGRGVAYMRSFIAGATSARRRCRPGRRW